MPITVEELQEVLENRNAFPFDPPQRDAITHGAGPLWIIAGPGTGKTEVLVVRCLKLICCDGVNPRSVLVTTFTEKAAKNLEDRLNDTFLTLLQAFPMLSDIDPSLIRIGTLHGLCNEIMQEFRYIAYQNLRLLDGAETEMFIRDQIAIRARSNYSDIQAAFPYLFQKPYHNLWDWTKALSVLLNRVIEDRIDISALQTAGGGYAALADVSTLYSNLLRERASCDFAHLQAYFLEFLTSPQGALFLVGDGTAQRPPLRYVLVDEYQDTNPIQEAIYFALASAAPHNITVVGDDDQALYRFRGGTVECMVSFGTQCVSRWGIAPTRVTLVDNHRSDERIVDWCSTYITSFPVMLQADVRVQGKPPLVAPLGERGDYPAVSYLRENTVGALANAFAETVRELVANHIVPDYSQCALLLRSTKDSPYNAGPYLAALRAHGVPVYNPRSKSYVDQPEVQQVLGALLRILDPDQRVGAALQQPSLRALVASWLGEYDAIAAGYPGLALYVQQSQQAIAAMGAGARITPAAPTILYRILSHSPFSDYQNNPVQDLRLSKMTRLFEAFCAQNRRGLSVDRQSAGRVSDWWVNTFYYVFCGYLESHGVDDDEDDEVVCPAGLLPIMTVHQAKGLEFDFVFVGTLGSKVSPETAHLVEAGLRPFRLVPPGSSHDPGEAAWHDEIRLHFVAYSRAKYALVLLATSQQLSKTETASFGGQGGPWARANLTRI